MAVARHLPRHHRRDHHAALASRRSGSDGPGRVGAHQDTDLRRRFLGFWRPDPLAHRARLLLRARVHQDRIGEPNRIPVRVLVWELVVRVRVQLGVQRGALGAGNSVGFGEGRRDLPPAGEVAVRRVR